MEFHLDDIMVVQNLFQFVPLEEEQSIQLEVELEAELVIPYGFDDPLNLRIVKEVLILQGQRHIVQVSEILQFFHNSKAFWSCEEFVMNRFELF